jgi:AcrR family transcriptional regulator
MIVSFAGILMQRRMAMTIPNARSGALTRARVADAAEAIVGEEGFSQLTVRGVARRLGVSAPSLYEYVSNKDDLVDLVVARALEEAATDWDPPTEWPDLLRYDASWWRRLLREHPAVLASVLRQPMAAPIALESVELVISSLTAAGLTLEEAVAAYGQLFCCVVGGTALVLSRASARRAAGTDEERERRRMVTTLSRLDPGKYPSLVAASEHLAAIASDGALDAGVEAVIQGVQHRLNCGPATQ